MQSTSLRTTDALDESEPRRTLLSSTRLMAPQPTGVQDYLLQHPDMAEVVETICKAASERFEEHTQLSLEVYRDPEIQDEYLTLYVRQETYDEQLLNTIDELSAECESRLANMSGWLLVTTDFCSPS